MTAKETKGVYFSELMLENVKCFREPVTLNFLNKDKSDWKRWTVILGDNGVGKTTLLQALASFEMYESFDDKGELSIRLKRSELDKNMRKYGGEIAVKLFDDSLSDFNQQPRFTLRKDYTVVPVKLPDGNTRNAVVWLQKVDSSFADKWMVFSYGANRIMGRGALADDFLSKNATTLFDDHEALINAEEWLLQLDYAASRDSGIKELAMKKRAEVISTLIELLPDIDDIIFSEPTKDQLVPELLFHTDFGWFNIHELSLGYRSMIAWVVDLAARMYARYHDSDNPLPEPAIVLVDEIDLHLHPKWQRNIFQYLSERFSATQFIVTAHSPLIVQAAPEDANIVVLRKEGNTVIIDNEVKNVRNWRIDQILTSDLFGLESARNPEITKEMEERVALISKGNRSVEEEKRLNELNELVYSLPTAENPLDIEAMAFIRNAASYFKGKKDNNE
ncbi:AAA family ATPase [Chitinophaga sp. YR627]|uniref:AAA family ATPase n=1 Tax=Chitinophaga sp. YR627 TaxID=1881041 RepID=UPI0015A5E7A4|nr:AAA family ATPase [Chitinophaga sp. YR627]